MSDDKKLTVGKLIDGLEGNKQPLTVGKLNKLSDGPPLPNPRLSSTLKVIDVVKLQERVNELEKRIDHIDKTLRERIRGAICRLADRMRALEANVPLPPDREKD